MLKAADVIEKGEETGEKKTERKRERGENNSIARKNLSIYAFNT
jgi:hypothetical protein